MTFLDCLLDEHRAIERMLRVLDDVASRVREGSQPPAIADDVIDVFERYADRRHHAKEEELLFPALANHAIGGVVAAMMHQHELGRTYLGTARADLAAVRAGDPGAAASFAASAAAFSGLLRDHISIEDHDVFAVAEQALSASEQAALQREFAAFDASPAAIAERIRWDDLIERARNEAGQVIA